MPYFVGHVSCLGILGVILKNSKLGSQWFFASDERMWPYGQTLPLDECEQLDLKHPKAMLQNDVCPKNSLRFEGVGGGQRFLSPGP